jgi:hypothetical protein
MDLDEPINPTPEQRAAHLRYRQWQDRITLDTRPKLSQRTYSRFVEWPLTLAALGCIWWSYGSRHPVRPDRFEFTLLGIGLGLLPLLVQKMFRIR